MVIINMFKIMNFAILEFTSDAIHVCSYTLTKEQAEQILSGNEHPGIKEH